MGCRIHLVWAMSQRFYVQQSFGPLRVMHNNGNHIQWHQDSRHAAKKIVFTNSSSSHLHLHSLLVYEHDEHILAYVYGQLQQHYRTIHHLWRDVGYSDLKRKKEFAQSQFRCFLGRAAVAGKEEEYLSDKDLMDHRD